MRTHAYALVYMYDNKCMQINDWLATVIPVIIQMIIIKGNREDWFEFVVVVVAVVSQMLIHSNLSRFSARMSFKATRIDP